MIASHRLLSKERKPIEVNIVAHEWSTVGDDDLQNPRVKNLYGEKAIFPVHGIVRLQGITQEAKHRLQRHCAELRSM